MEANNVQDAIDLRKENETLKTRIAELENPRASAGPWTYTGEYIHREGESPTSRNLVMASEYSAKEIVLLLNRKERDRIEAIESVGRIVGFVKNLLKELKITCPHCGSPASFNENRGVYCGECNNFDVEKDLILGAPGVALLRKMKDRHDRPAFWFTSEARDFLESVMGKTR